MVTFGETPRRSARAKSHHHAPAFDGQRYQPACDSANGGETPNRASTLALILDRVNSVRPASGRCTIGKTRARHGAVEEIS